MEKKWLIRRFKNKTLKTFPNLALDSGWNSLPGTLPNCWQGKRIPFTLLLVLHQIWTTTMRMMEIDCWQFSKVREPTISLPSIKQTKLTMAISKDSGPTFITVTAKGKELQWRWSSTREKQLKVYAKMSDNLIPRSWDSSSEDQRYLQLNSFQ
jgi:hypothetical protein